MNTSDRDLGEYNVSIDGSNIDNTQFTLRDPQLDIAVDDTNVSTDDTIETDVSAVAGTRDIEATLLDSGDDEINTSSVTTLDGQGEADIDFATATADGGNELDTPYNVSQAGGQTVSGTTTLAPGTELTLRVRSQDGVSPSFLKTASPDVQSDRTWSATFDFSEQNIGDEYDIIVRGADAPETDEEGQVVESVSTATPTPEPDTDNATPEPDTDTATPDEQEDTATPDEQDTQTSMSTDTATSTPTSTPGFGVIVALTALLAAALLAVRRGT